MTPCNKKFSFYNNFHKKIKLQKRVIDRNNFTYRKIIEIIEIYLRRKGLNILDIGCGSGTLSFYLSKNRNYVTGIDISKSAIDCCKKNSKMLGLKNIYFEVFNFPQEYPKKKYDIVILVEVIEHLNNIQKAFKTIFNLLNNDGILILSTPSPNAPLLKIGGIARKFDKKVGHIRRISLASLTKYLKREGFKILKSYEVEGILRNFLFLNSFAGSLIKFIKGPFSDVVTYLDDKTVILFGESNIIVVAKK